METRRMSKDLEVEVENVGRLDMVVDLTNEVVKSLACNLKYEPRSGRVQMFKENPQVDKEKSLKTWKTKLMKDDSQEKYLKRFRPKLNEETYFLRN
ncbi:hypothetical protein E3N88_42106 [Mikania micrantha]|uniref:Uncharacterized protein n=1 Tax=Mikania micrantha TaxID=192012 RepID=A0A5N6LIY0_9ASTR|nr:hypothetical protein E3N88_42106 [Mikania micrantha]